MNEVKVEALKPIFHKNPVNPPSEIYMRIDIAERFEKRGFVKIIGEVELNDIIIEPSVGIVIDGLESIPSVDQEIEQKDNLETKDDLESKDGEESKEESKEEIKVVDPVLNQFSKRKRGAKKNG